MASILIIDGEVAIATAFAMLFRHDGQHTVAEAHTGAEGIAAVERLRPDLVLLDVRLPDMTGFDVLAAIREHSPVVILVTADGDVPMAVDALHKGAENFLVKPVDVSHLTDSAERALEKAQLRRLIRWLTEQRGADVTHHEPRSLSEVEREHIDRTLRAHAQNRTHAAKELGISRATLIKKIREYDLSNRSGQEDS